MKEHPRFIKFKDWLGVDWKEPTCAAYNEYQDEIVLEYWSKSSKKLTIFLDINDETWLKSWGHRILEDMEGGEITSIEQVKELWKWLDTP